MSGGHHLEVERKFDVDDAVAAPVFADITGVARAHRLPSQTLDAQYFDTPAHDLAANRITLRRRTGGTDAGWHLKLPAGPDARTEIQVPLGAGDGAVPAQLRDVVLAIVRDRPLVPIVRITTDRDVAVLHGSDGALLAEFCDDRVSASTINIPDAAGQRWREWELELLDPDADPTVAGELLDRLSAGLLAAGAAPARHHSKLTRALGAAVSATAPSHRDPVRRAVAGQVAELLVWDRAVRADADDAVHQMRVTLRKLRSLLQVSGDSFGLGVDAPIIDELRWLAGLLGVARDAEVLGQRYRQALAQLAPELVRGRVAERLVDGATERYQDARCEALAAMRSGRYFRLLDALDALVAESSAGRRAEAPADLRAAYRRVRKAAKAARGAPPAGRDEALHRIRKGAKRLRYTAAAIHAPRIAERAKVVQTLLGDHQDSVVSRAHLLAQATAAHAAGEDTFTYGVLYQQEDDLARRCRAQLDDALAELATAVRKRH